MDVNTIIYVFDKVFAMFAPAITVLIGIVVAGVGLRWVINVFMK